MMSRILPLAFILIAIGVFFGYVKPTWQTEVKKTQAEIDTYDKALAAADAFFAKVDDLKAQKDAIGDDRQARLQSFLPDGVDNIQLILDLTELASRSNMEVSTFDTPQDEGETDATNGEIGSIPAVESLPITLEATGTYDDFRAFLAGVEQSLRPLDVTDIEIGESDTGVYDYSMTMRFYWLR